MLQVNAFKTYYCLMVMVKEENITNTSEWNASKSAWSHQPIFPQLKDYFILVEADSKLLKSYTVHGDDKYFTWRH